MPDLDLSGATMLDPSWLALLASAQGPNANPNLKAQTTNTFALPSWPSASGTFQDNAGFGALPPGMMLSDAPFPGLPYSRASQDTTGFGPSTAPPPALPSAPTDFSSVNRGGSAGTVTPDATGAPAPPVPETSLLGRLQGALEGGFGNFWNAVKTHPATLLALGGGLAGAPSWGTGISRGLTAAAPASQLDIRQQMQLGGVQQTYKAIAQALVSKGMAPDKAGSLALAATYNPEVYKSIAAQVFGPPTAPATTNYKDESGIDRTAVWDPTRGAYKDIQTGRPLGSTIAAPAVGTGAVAPAAVPGAPAVVPTANAPGSPAMAPGTATIPAPIVSNPGQSGPLGPPPKGANTPAWIQAQTEASAGESKEAREKAQGGIEAIQKLSSLKALVTKAPEDAFGLLQGQSWFQPFNAAASAINRATGTQDVGGDLLSQHEQLSSGYKEAAASLTKALTGATRVSPELIKQTQETLGGTTVSDKDTAVKLIDNATVRAYDSIADGIRRGVTDPKEVLQTVKTPEEAKALGRGALFIDPAGNIRRNPI